MAFEDSKEIMEKGIKVAVLAREEIQKNEKGRELLVAAS